MNCGTSCQPTNEKGDHPRSDLEEANQDSAGDDSLSLNSFTSATKNDSIKIFDSSISSPVRKRTTMRSTTSLPLSPKYDGNLSNHSKYRRVSSIMNSGYALLEYSTSMIDESRNVDEEGGAITTNTDHYTSSFARSAAPCC